jgi:CheY-like chemotaxis protein
MRLIHALQPDLLLLDIAMPGADGISLATDILALATPPAGLSSLQIGDRKKLAIPPIRSVCRSSFS